MPEVIYWRKSSSLQASLCPSTLYCFAESLFFTYVLWPIDFVRLKAALPTVKMHWNHISSNWNDFSANVLIVALLHFRCKKKKKRFCSINNIFSKSYPYSYIIRLLYKGFSVQTQLQIPFRLYSRIAVGDGSNVKIEWIWMKSMRYGMHIFLFVATSVVTSCTELLDLSFVEEH